MKSHLSEVVSSTELRFFFWIVSFNENKFLSNLSRGLSRIGDGPFYAFVGICFCIFGGTKGRYLFATGCLAYAMELPLYWILKNSIKRDRPFQKHDQVSALVKPNDTFSFPSGHTAAAFVFATILSTFFPVLTIPIYFLACMIGISRVMLGVHYPSDILAGFVLGKVTAWIALGII